MDKKPHKPYVPATTSMPELTLKAVVLGVLMAVVLGAANAYLGMKAGLTVAATFPAAVVAMAALRPFKGSVLEENIARTTASVGEALVAGAIFTIPAFVISGAWEELRYWESTAIMLIGGVLGVLFIIVLKAHAGRRSRPSLPRERRCRRDRQGGAGRADGSLFRFRCDGSRGALGALQELERHPSSSSTAPTASGHSVDPRFRSSKRKSPIAAASTWLPRRHRPLSSVSASSWVRASRPYSSPAR